MARTASPTERDRLGHTNAGVLVRAWLADVGGTMRECQATLGVDPITGASVEWSLDSPTAAWSLTLHPGQPGLDPNGARAGRGETSPFVLGSGPNVLYGGRMADVGRRVWIDAVVAAPGVPAVQVPALGQDGGWQRLVDGVVDTVSVGRSGVTLRGRDQLAALVDTTLEADLRIGTTAGVPLEQALTTILQAAFANNGWPNGQPITLVTPVSPNYGVLPTTLKRGMTVYEAMLTLVRLIGWRLAVRWVAAGTWQLQLLAVARDPQAGTPADHTLAAADWRVVDTLGLDRTGIRTVIRGEYTDSGTGQRTTRSVQAPAAERTAYGYRPMLLVEAATSPIKTAAQMDAMLAPILADLQDPPLTHSGSARLWWPLEVGDVVDVTAIPGLTAGTNRLAVRRIAHRFANGSGQTSIGLGGRPAALTAGWLALQSRGVDDPGAGTPGIPGQPGQDGQTLYEWVAYSNASKGTVDFTTGAPAGRVYQGRAYGKTTQTRSTNPADYEWTRYTGPPAWGMQVTGACVEAGTMVVKNGGGFVWDSTFQSTEGWTSGCFCTFSVPTIAGYELAIGISTVPAKAGDFTAIDFALLFAGDGNMQTLGPGANGQTLPGVTAGDVWAFRYDNATVVYERNGAVFHVEAVGPGRTFYLDGKILTPGGRVVSLNWGPTGRAGDPGAAGAAGATGPTGPPGANAPGAAFTAASFAANYGAGSVDATYTLVAAWAGATVHLTAQDLQPSTGAVADLTGQPSPVQYSPAQGPDPSGAGTGLVRFKVWATLPDGTASGVIVQTVAYTYRTAGQGV